MSCWCCCVLLCVVVCCCCGCLVVCFFCLFVWFVGCLFVWFVVWLVVWLFVWLFVFVFVFVVFFDRRRGTSTWSRHGRHYSTHWQLALAEEPVAVAFVTLPSLTREGCRRLHQYGAFRVLPFAEQECALLYSLLRCAPPHAVFSNTLSALLPSVRTPLRFLSVETLAAPLPRGAGPLFVRAQLSSACSAIQHRHAVTSAVQVSWRGSARSVSRISRGTCGIVSSIFSSISCSAASWSRFRCSVGAVSTSVASSERSAHLFGTGLLGRV